MYSVYISESETCCTRCPADYLCLFIYLLKDAFSADRVVVVVLLNKHNLVGIGSYFEALTLHFREVTEEQPRNLREGNLFQAETVSEMC
jgi:hypothetical protein